MSCLFRAALERFVQRRRLLTRTVLQLSFTDPQYPRHCLAWRTFCAEVVKEKLASARSPRRMLVSRFSQTRRPPAPGNGGLPLSVIRPCSMLVPAEVGNGF